MTTIQLPVWLARDRRPLGQEPDTSLFINRPLLNRTGQWYAPDDDMLLQCPLPRADRFGLKPGDIVLAHLVVAEQNKEAA